MICRCQTPAEHAARAEAFMRETSWSPDNTNFQIQEIEERYGFLILKVLYPNCAKCAYEGNKIMVFEGVGIKDAIKWRKLDPHFRQGSLPPPINEAPSPIARFPGNDIGWRMALQFVEMLDAKKKYQGYR